MYRLAICEDDAYMRQSLCALCEDILAERGTLCTVTPFDSAERLGKAMKAGAQFDLLCLDILMDGENGMELARRIRQTDDRISILFITSSSDFLKDGYQVRPIEYLFKPVQREELARALDTDLRLNHSPRTVSLTVRNRTVLLPMADISYAESRDHSVELHLKEEMRVLSLSLTELEQRLPREQFCRCHNSYLVNMACIAEISRKEIILTDGTAIPIGRSYSKDVQNRFVHFLNQ